MDFNRDFARVRDCDEDALQGVYDQLGKVLHRPSMVCETPQQAVEVVQGLEYTLQLLWKFPVDSNFHNYWWDLNGCNCGGMDSRDMLGSGLRWTNDTCPYHGTNPADTWDDRRFK